MCDVIKNRGPDDRGFFTDKGIGLGHRRLSIIDLEGSHQPVCNGDNFLSLRDNLEKQDHRFQTSSDTEGGSFPSNRTNPFNRNTDAFGRIRMYNAIRKNTNSPAQ